MIPHLIPAQSTDTTEQPRQRWLIGIFWLLAIVLGLMQVLDAGQTFMDPDGIVYLDIGDAYFRGDWSTALNGLWPPLYSWLLGLVMFVFKPSPYWEFFVVRLVNFGIYLFTLGCFHFLMLQLLHYQQRRKTRLAGEGNTTLPEWAWLVLGYGLFIWSSLGLITVLEDSPDMAVAALIYLASGILLRLRLGLDNWRNFVFLGVVLGLGYLTKSFMLQLTFVFLGMSLLAVGNFQKAIPRVLVALLIFLLIQAPFIFALSMVHGRLTFRDSGPLHTAFNLNRIPYANWQGEPPGNGTPVHPTRKILDLPAIYEFGSPIGGTYPPWHDPIYWNEGVIPHFDLGNDIRLLQSNIEVYFDTFFRSGGSLVVGCLVLYLIAGRRYSIIKDIAEHWTLLIPAIAILGAIPLTAEIEKTHVGPFVVILWLGLYSGLRLVDSPEVRGLVAKVITATVIVILITTAFPITLQASSSARELIRGRYKPWGYEQGQVAAGLHQMGLQPGDSVVFMGNGFHNSWARLARVRIVAELPASEVNNFWAADDFVKAKVIKVFAGTGAKAIITERVPGIISNRDWHVIGDTNYFVYLFTVKTQMDHGY